MKGANMNDNPKAASTQESIASHLNFADITDPAEREQLLMEELPLFSGSVPVSLRFIHKL